MNSLPQTDRKLALKAHEQVKFCSDPVRSEDYFPEWKPAFTPVYKTNQVALQICFLNAWLLHKHIDDVRRDLNFTNTDINIFSET